VRSVKWFEATAGSDSTNAGAMTLRRGMAVALLLSAVLGARGTAKDLEKPAAEKLSLEKQIEAARELVLSNKRLDALKKLRAIAPGRNGLRDQRVERAAVEIAHLFLAEKANAQYAVAEATWMSKPKEALEILQTLMAANSPEPAGNILLPVLGARAALRASDCSRAATMTKLADSIWKTPEVFLLGIQAQDCQNEASASAPEIKIPDGEDLTEVAIPVKLVLIRDSLRRKDFKTAKAQLAIVEAQASDNPELWNLRWRAFLDRGDARRYLRLCSELTPKRRERFKLQPD
jgi:hypothetical protein